MTPSPRAVALIQQFESCRLTAYQDERGVWTIGWGHTAGCYPGQQVSQQQADMWLVKDVADAAKQLNTLGELTQMEFDALTSFIFNEGAGHFMGSTMRRLILAGDFKAAAAEFPKWIFAGGHESAGLVRRRAAERALFESAP